MKLTYRADIDGLRAIAVLAVIFYHLAIKPFSGGFIGVDIFFVISGYLITTIIFNEIGENKFSLAKFYDRRIRRIFPALFTVLLVTLVACTWLFSAAEFKEFGSSLIATTLFSSNFLFWSQAGYFDAPSSLKPLLHTWSLAVEEQYYIFFPLLLVFLSRYLRSGLKFVLLGIAVVSFVFSIYNLNYDAAGAFYLVHTRIWELLVGSLLAIKIVPVVKNVYIRNLLGVVGLTMLAMPMFLYTNNTPFPGVAALIPVLGTALMIYVGTEGETFAGKILGFGPIVFIGKISYSLYLWHWPIIVLAKYYLIIELKSVEIAAVLLMIFILSILSWYFIENPFRQKAVFAGRKIFVFAVVAMVLTIALGSSLYLNKGFPTRFVNQKAISPTDHAELKKWQKCTPPLTGELSDSLTFCNIGKKEIKSTPTFLLLGDSHAGAIAPAIQDSAFKAGVSGLIVYKVSCPLLLDISVNTPKVSACSKFTRNLISYIHDHPNLKTIILVSRWAIYAQGTRYKSEGAESISLFDLSLKSAQRNTTMLFDWALDRTVNKLLKMGRNVIIVSQIPEIGYDVPSVLSIAQRTGRDANKIIAPSLREYTNRNETPAAIIKSLAEKKDVQIVDPWKVLCVQARCQVAIDGNALYYDDDHISVFGAHYIAGIFDVVFKTLAGQ